jgi:hypothetical protein
MKNSFALFLTIIIIMLFSLLITQVHSTQSLDSNNQSNAYVYAQAKLYAEAFKAIILNAKTLNCQQILKMDNPNFDIQATVEYLHLENNCTNTNAIIDINVRSKTTSLHVNVHERFTKKL